MAIKVIYDSQFDKVEEGYHLFTVDDVKKVTENEKVRIDVRTIISGGVCDGFRHTEFFNIKGTKSERGDQFSQGRLLALFNVAGLSEKPRDEYPDDFLNKNLEKIIKQLDGKMFGGLIKHDKQYNNAKIVTFMSKKDVMKKMEDSVSSSPADVKDTNSTPADSDWPDENLTDDIPF